MATGVEPLDGKSSEAERHEPMPDIGRAAGPDLLLVTTTGYAKRLPVADIPLTKRGREGVRVSFEALAAAVVVRATDEVVIATRGGMIERVAAADVPVMDRRARGARVIGLGPGDVVAKVALVPQTPSELHPGGVCGPATSELALGLSVALNDREAA